MICPSCGQQNQQNARFCNACGMSLSQRGLGGNKPAAQPSTQLNRQPMGPQSQVAQPPKKNEIVGVVQDVQRRTEHTVPWISAGPGERTVQILEFRLEQDDSDGNRVGNVPVEMRGRSIVGFISNGNNVQVFGKMKNGVFHAKQIYDLTTNSIVR